MSGTNGARPSATPLKRASWIWKREDAITRDQYLCFRRSFWLEEADDDAFVDVSVDSDFVLYLNGKEVGRGQFSDFAKRKTWSRISLKGALQKGQNLLAIAVFHRGEHFADHQAGPGGLIVGLSAPSLELVSDSEWRWAYDPAFESGKGERMTMQTGYTFHYDARLEQPWKELEFDDQLWEQAAVKQEEWLGPIWKELVPRPLPHGVLEPFGAMNIVMQGTCIRDPEDSNCHVSVRMARTALRAESASAVFFGQERGPTAFHCGSQVAPQPGKPLCLRPPEHGTWGRYLIIDLGEQTVGLIEFEVEAPEGCRIEIAHGEHLDDGRVRASIKGRQFADSYICGRGRRRFQMPFRRLGCRYLEIHISDAATIYSAGLRPLKYPTVRKGSFLTMDPMADRLHEVAVRTLELCRHEHYEDCPWREQALYGFDGRMQALFGYYSFGDYRFPEVSLTLLGESLADDGFIAMTAPGEGNRAIPIFTFSWIAAVAEHWLFSGSATLFERFETVIEQSLRSAFEKRDHKTGLYLAPEGDRYWHFYDWVPGLNGSSSAEAATRLHAAYNLFLHEAGRAWHWMLLESGRAKEAEAIGERLRQLRLDFHAQFWNETHGLVESYHSSTGVFHEVIQALALGEGMGTPESRRILAGKIMQGEVQPGMLSGKFYLLRGMAPLGKQERAWVVEHLGAIWQKMLFAGATTLWETEHGASDFGGAGSLCHGWSALPVYYHAAWVLGIYPLTPGFDRFAVRIYPGRFQKVSGVVPTPAGPISLVWQQRDAGLHLELEGPEDCHPVLIDLPGSHVANVLYNGTPIPKSLSEPTEESEQWIKGAVHFQSLRSRSLESRLADQSNSSAKVLA